MSEQLPKDEKLFEQETLEQKRARLGPVFERSCEALNNPETSFEESALVVTQRDSRGKENEILGLIVMSIDETGVELSYIEDDGGLSDSAWMKWESIVDARKME